MNELPRYPVKDMKIKTRKRWHMRYSGMMKLITVMVLVLLTIMAAGCKKKAGAPPPPEVAVVTLQPEKVTITTELPGRVSAFLIAEVRPQVNGIIKKRLFTEGADVKAGEVLYQIDPAPYQAAFDNASASLARAEANLPPVRSKAQRYKELVAIKAVSQQEFEDVSALHMQAEADVKYWKAAVETARINLEYTRVKAPIAGRIGKSDVTVGALATANQAAPFTTIQKLDPVYVDATQSSANLLHLKRILASGKLVNKGPDSRKGKAHARGRHSVRSGRDIEIFRYNGRPKYRVFYPPDGLPESRNIPSCRVCMPGRSFLRELPKTLCLFPSRV